MTFKEVQELIKLVGKSNLTEFKMKNGDFEVSIRTKKYGRYKDRKVSTVQPSIIPVPSAPVPGTPAVTAPAAARSTSEATVPSDPGAAEKSGTNYLEIKSPMVGTFYRSPSPDKPNYVKVGDSVEVGSVVCIVEAMKLFNEIESEVAGTIVKVMADDASPVEYDQVLYLVEPNS
ncbi:MAG: acetyl-CoA carboxylase biotin carboxyl carrier protein [Bacteroidia bacterium]|nr:acetyl-CoA carboxylase biotin carboxyl carrier protein [Bacteroidia bacterium]